LTDKRPSFCFESLRHLLSTVAKERMLEAGLVPFPEDFEVQDDKTVGENVDDVDGD
jgi:hypothetical protein